MRTSDSPTPDRRATPPVARPDVMTVRSRMRTKYGSQVQIQQVAGMLADDETLLLLAVAELGASQDHHHHGLLALSDRRLIFVPRASGGEVHEIALTSLGSLIWTPGPGSGTVSVLAADVTASYARIANADARDLVTRIRALQPHVVVASPASGQNS